MSVENVKKFYEAVSKDEALKQKFVQLSQKYQGQPMDEVRVWSIMEQEALPLAAQMGYSFTIDDVKSYDLAMQQAKMGCELSDEEMQAVTGGETITGFCFVIGYSNISWSGWGSEGSYDAFMTGFCVGPGILT